MPVSFGIKFERTTSMLRIGEFSKLAQVSTRMLRYYDEQELLKPARVDEQTGYRFYQADQLSTLQKIILLRDLKFSLPEIIDLVHENTSDTYFKQRLNEKYQHIELEISEEKKRLQMIKQTIRRIDYPEEEYYPVTFIEIPKETVLSLRKKIPTYYHEGILWEEMMREVPFLAVEKINNGTDNFTLFHDNGFQETNVELEICLKIKKRLAVPHPFTCYETASIPLAASIMVVGPYERLKHAYASFANWLDESKEYSMLEPTRQVSHRGPHEETDPNNYVTEIQIPIQKIS
jgi:DNA-binding transcriptional MerR regulator